MATPDSPFGKALVALARQGVDFVVVGVGGINFYARDPSTAFVTQDLDVWVRPVVAQLRNALKALSGAGFTFEAGGEPFVDVADDVVLANVIRMTSNLVARGPLDVRADVMLAMTGHQFDPVFAGATEFTMDGQRVRVAALDTILEAKQAAGREKDLVFLEAFRARRKEFLPKPSAKRGKRPK